MTVKLSSWLWLSIRLNQHRGPGEISRGRHEAMSAERSGNRKRRLIESRVWQNESVDKYEYESSRSSDMQYFVWGIDGPDSKAQRIAVMEPH